MYLPLCINSGMALIKSTFTYRPVDGEYAFQPSQLRMHQSRKMHGKLWHSTAFVYSKVGLRYVWSWI